MNPPAPAPGRPTTNGSHVGPSAHSAAVVCHAELARRLLVHEAGEGEPRSLSAAVNRVSRKLARRLSRLVSPVGSQAMLSRALHLARREFSFLEGVSAGPDGDFHGLEDALRYVEEGEARAGLQTVLTRLIDLLVAFIGEELTARLVDQVWPEPLDTPVQSGQPEGRQTAS